MNDATTNELAALALLMGLSPDAAVALPTAIEVGAAKVGMSKAKFTAECFRIAELRAYLATALLQGRWLRPLHQRPVVRRPMNFLDTISVGQKVGIVSYNGHRNNYVLATVCAVSKTTCTTSRTVRGSANGQSIDMTVKQTWNLNSGYERGTRGDWRRDSLVSEAQALAGIADSVLYFATMKRIGERERMVNDLVKSCRNDAAFRATLAKLNSREYVE